MATITVSLGELLDRLSILQLKLDHQGPPPVRQEFDRLQLTLKECAPESQTRDLYQSMLVINRELWVLEDRMHGLLVTGDDRDTAVCGRQIAYANRKRSDWKRYVNESVGDPVEFKLYGGSSQTAASCPPPRR